MPMPAAEEALAVADAAIAHVAEPCPMLHYYRGWALCRLGRTEEAAEAAARAERVDGGLLPGTA